jgi:hypothetical protein
MKGITFTEPLFHKVVSGEKTQTRRIVKPQPAFEGEFRYACPKDENQKDIIPRYLKEPYARSYIPGIEDKDDNPFTTAIDPKCWETIYRYDDCIYAGAEWKNAISMPAKYARYFIEITAVRCERLQDISDEDCLKEGIQEIKGFNPVSTCYEDCVDKNLWTSPQQAYAALIDQIYGKGTWERNPYVWVYDFKLVKNEMIKQF